MPQAKGANAQVIIQEQSAFDTEPAADAQLVPIASCGLRQSRPLASSPLLRGNRNPAKPDRDNTEVSGPIGTVLQAYPGLLFKAALGAVVTTGAGPYVHTFTLGASLPWLLVEKGFTDIGKFFKYLNCKVNRMHLAMTPSGQQKIEFDLLGVGEEISGTSFDATPTDLGVQAFDGYTLGTIEEGGAAIADVVGIDLTLENGLDGDQFVLGGGGKRQDLPEGTAKVSGTLKARFTDTALYQKGLDHTESSLRTLFALGDGLGSAGNESIEFTLGELVYTPTSPAINGPKGIIADYAFEAFYEDGADASALKVVLKNTQSAL